MRTIIFIIICFPFTVNCSLFAEGEQKSVQQENLRIVDYSLTNFEFALKTLLQTLQLVNSENTTRFSMELLNTSCSQIEYLIIQGILTEDITKKVKPHSFLYKNKNTTKQWNNIKNQWIRIRNHDYYQSPVLKKLFERYDCNMSACFEMWEIP